MKSINCLITKCQTVLSDKISFTYIFMAKPGKDLYLSERPLTVGLVLKGSDLLDGDFRERLIINSRTRREGEGEREIKREEEVSTTFSKEGLDHRQNTDDIKR